MMTMPRLTSIVLLAWGFCLIQPIPHSAQIFSKAGRTQFLGGLGIRSFYQQVRKETLFRGTDEIADPLNRDVRVEMWPFVVGYGLTPQTMLLGVLPHVEKRLTSHSGGNTTILGTNGFGDVTLLARHRLRTWTYPQGLAIVAVEGGVKLPTGRDDEIGAGGTQLPPSLQLGSGSWDFPLAFIATYARGRWLSTADLRYLYTNQANGFEFGDEFHYNAMLKYRIWPVQYPGKDTFILLELNGIHEERSEAGGRAVGNSGGETIFLSPGIQWLPAQNIVLEAGVQLPVYQDRNGMQLGRDVTVLTGFRWTFLPMRR